MPYPTTLTIGAVVFPYSPWQITDESEGIAEGFDIDGSAPLIFGTGTGVRQVQLTGSICVSGMSKEDLETNYGAPLRSYRGTAKIVESPSGAYDGTWLVKRVGLKEQAEGLAVARLLYTIVMWQPNKLVVL